MTAESSPASEAEDHRTYHAHCAREAEVLSPQSGVLSQVQADKKTNAEEGAMPAKATS